MIEVPATEFAKNFGRYKEAAQREPIAITSHGRTSGYFISQAEFDEYVRLKAQARAVLRVEDLSEEDIRSIAAAEMDAAHDHLNRLLDDDR